MKKRPDEWNVGSDGAKQFLKLWYQKGVELEVRRWMVRPWVVCR